MTPQEFKAWFDGFTENCDGAPTEKQWKKIKAKVADIDGTSVSYPVYVDRYWTRPYVSPYYTPFYLSQTVASGVGTTGVSYTASNKISDNVGWNSVAAMYAAGTEDAKTE